MKETDLRILVEIDSANIADKESGEVGFFANGNSITTLHKLINTFNLKNSYTCAFLENKKTFKIINKIEKVITIKQAIILLNRGYVISIEYYAPHLYGNMAVDEFRLVSAMNILKNKKTYDQKIKKKMCRGFRSAAIRRECSASKKNGGCYKGTWTRRTDK